ncbi:MAG: terminase gpA endonuclease subunit, partial [Roseiarcus sp.]
VRVVGTFSLKSVFYEDLWKLGIKSGKSSDPPGMCHFPDFIDDVYFKQLTSEYVVNEIGRHGRPKRVWRLRHGRDNHLLDCRVYNLALAEYLGLQKMSSDEWAMLARERGATALSPPPLFSAQLIAPGTPAETPSQATQRNEIEQVVAAAAKLKAAAEAGGESERRILWQTRTKT